ncbi:MAG: bifunctional ornithine acetyltransferase/N-acetylglutamate synthase, partial [Planifilum fulgidum]
MNGQGTQAIAAETGFEVVAEPSVTSPSGFVAGGVHAGLKRKKRDLGMIFCEVPASAAAVYTMNAFQAAPLKVTRDSLAVEGKLQAVVVNSGNANACTGERGWEDALKTRREAAGLLGIPEHRVAVASTGVIGEFLPMDRMVEGLGRLVKEVGKEGHLPFCESILTTDTCTKAAEVVLRVEGRPVRIAGAAKGSGMIHPRMATMLAFLTTDAVIDPRHLQHLLREVTDETFNMITVDGDCSTNDMVLALASGAIGNANMPVIDIYGGPLGWIPVFNPDHVKGHNTDYVTLLTSCGGIGIPLDSNDLTTLNVPSVEELTNLSDLIMPGLPTPDMLTDP